MIWSESIKQGWTIEEKNPLKQGLKHPFAAGPAIFIANWREESIKTRIETYNGEENRIPLYQLKRRIH